MKFKPFAYILLILPFSAHAFRNDGNTNTLNYYNIKFSSYIDGSYNYLVRSPFFTSGQFNRLNDIAENGVRIQQLYFGMACDDPGFGGLLNIISGLDAYNLAPAGWNADMFQIKNFGLAVPDAYLQYRFNTFVIKGGEMSSMAGFESYLYTGMINFSHSILSTYAQPNSYTGFRLTKSMTDHVDVTLGLVNSWGSIRQPAHLSALEWAFTYTLDKFNLTVDGFLGPEYLVETYVHGPQGTRRLLDIYGTYIVSKPVTLSFNLDVGSQSKAALPEGEIGSARWAGLAGYMTYYWNDRWYTGLRAEIFDDYDGYRSGVRQVWKEGTVSLGYTPTKSLTLTAETRHDFSNVASFLNRDWLGANPNQQSYSLEVLYQFI